MIYIFNWWLSNLTTDDKEKGLILTNGDVELQVWCSVILKAKKENEKYYKQENYKILFKNKYYIQLHVYVFCNLTDGQNFYEIDDYWSQEYAQKKIWLLS